MSLDLNSSSVEYKDNKVVIKSIPKEGENLSVFMRPGDEVIFEIDGFDPDTLEYILVGGDIVVSFTGEGLLTFPSLGLMGFSSNPPLFSFGGNKSISVDNILSKIEEVNELPITSVDASFKVTTSNKNEDEVPFGSKTEEATQTQVIVVPQTQSFSDTQSKREDFTKTEQNSASSNFSSNSEPISNSTLISSTYTNPYSDYTKPNDFDAYKPEVEMIPKPDVEMIPKPDGEMIPKPDGEMIPENDFTDYFPENDFDGYGDGYGNGDGDGEGPGEGVPSFGFKATAHQVRFSETTNDEGQVEILGGGGSINGYKFDSITNQFEPETIDMSTRTENMVIRAENSTYFSDTPSAPRGINTITFKDLIKGQSVTVDGLTLTAKDGDISASSVATAFASLSAGATTGNIVTGGSWDGNLSNGWSSDPLLLNSVTFTSQAAHSVDALDDLTIESFNSEGVADSTLVTFSSQSNNTTADTYTLTFQNLTEGQSVTVDGLTLTATGGAIGAAGVATAFASLGASADGTGVSVTNGYWSGALTANWASGAVFAINSDVTFKSTEENSDISSFSASSAGLTIDAPTAPDVVSTDGDNAQTETHVLTFKDLLAGQSITVDGLTLTASDTITAANVAAAFADLAADSTGLTKSGGGANTVTNGDFSGKLSAAWASDDITGTSTVTFTSTAANENVTDIAISYAGSTIDAPEEIDIISSQDVAYLSRVLRFEPNMPEGFYVDSFIIEGLPTGVAILDKDANEITGSNITKDDMIFKNELGEIIAYDSADFLTSFKSLEFTIKYPNDIVDPFNLSITANYKIDEAYADSVTEPEQSYTNEYTFALKDITSASDYTYNKGEFSGGLDEGFILAKEPNYNIIKDGSGDSIIYGGNVKDIIYDGAGDDTYYLSAGDDLVYGGSGTNYIYGDTDNDSAEAVKYKGEDSVSYELVQSFESSEVKLLAQNGFISPEENQKLNPTDETADDSANTIDIEMLASYKGVYVDLDGVHIDGLNIDVNGDGEITEDDKINTISKFANRVGKFTYDEDGNAISSTIGENITFTSVTQGAAVVDIVVTSAGALEVAAPAALGVATIEGVESTTTETHTITFQDLIAGQSVTIDGLTLTATGAISAANVATAFADLAASSNGSTKSDGSTTNTVVNGSWSGYLSVNWASDVIADTATVTFTSQTLTTPVTDIVISTSGMSSVAAPESAVSSAVQGNDLTTEQHNVVFKDLIAGQSVSVGGLTLTASAALSAREIAAAYANLAAGATEGNDVIGGEWSGTFSSAWTSGAQEQIGLDNLQETGYDILEDIENIIGSNYSDTIYGNADKDNILTGLKGGDILDGRGGENKL
ncbi:MAG: hypothetical protein PHS42_09850, partial [Sulfurimonas sp.]|nr:hypothetical protein [Sulfurimonas sp.]